MTDELRRRIMRLIIRTPGIDGVAWPNAARILADEIVDEIRPYVTAKKAMDLSGYAVHHIDGNPHNYKLENLRLVKIRPQS